MNYHWYSLGCYLYDDALYDLYFENNYSTNLKNFIINHPDIIVTANQFNNLLSTNDDDFLIQICMTRKIIWDYAIDSCIIKSSYILLNAMITNGLDVTIYNRSYGYNEMIISSIDDDHVLKIRLLYSCGFKINKHIITSDYKNLDVTVQRCLNSIWILEDVYTNTKRIFIITDYL